LKNKNKRYLIALIDQNQRLTTGSEKSIIGKEMSNTTLAFEG
jgi:hypothetical protein